MASVFVLAPVTFISSLIRPSLRLMVVRIKYTSLLCLQHMHSSRAGSRASTRVGTWRLLRPGYAPLPVPADYFFRAAAMRVRVAFASPKTIMVLGRRKRSFSIPANPGFMLRFSTITVFARSAFKIGIP